MRNRTMQPLRVKGVTDHKAMICSYTENLVCRPKRKVYSTRLSRILQGAPGQLGGVTFQIPLV